MIRRVLHVIITLGAVIGTAVQGIASLREHAITRKEAMQWWAAEDDLINEHRGRRARRRVRRELRGMRTTAIATELRWIRAALWGWSILCTASAMALYQAVVDLAA